jgi:hypothetical protein
MLAAFPRSRRSEQEDGMISDLVGFVVGLSPLFALLLWRARIDRQQHVAAALRSAVHAGAARLFDEGSPLAVSVQPPTVWRPGAVRLSIPEGNTPLIARTFETVMARVPQGYEIVIRCGAQA